MVLAVGPWQWVFKDEIWQWSPPSGVPAGIDLRSQPEQQQRGGTGGLGLFVFPGLIPADYLTLGDVEDTLGLTKRREIEDRFKITRDRINATRVADILLEIATEHRDATGRTGHTGLVPNHRGNFEIWHRGVLWRSEPCDIASPRWAGVRALLREDRRELEKQVRNGLLSPRQARKALGYWAQKYKCDHTEFFGPGETVVDPLPPETALGPDPFSYSNGDLQTVSSSVWTNQGFSSFNIVTTDRVKSNGSLGPTFRQARYESDLSGADQSGQIDTDDLGDTFGWVGPTLRYNSAAGETYYGGRIRQNGGGVIYKMNAGTASSIDSGGTDGSSTKTIKLQISSNALTLTRNTTVMCGPTSDGSPLSSSYLRTGIFSHSSAEATGDNWQAADLGGGGVSVDAGIAAAAAAVVAPTVVLGSITMAPANASAAAAVVAPTVVLGAVTVAPAPAIAAALTVAPTVIGGGTSGGTPRFAGMIAEVGRLANP